MLWSGIACNHAVSLPLTAFPTSGRPTDFAKKGGSGHTLSRPDGFSGCKPIHSMAFRVKLLYDLSSSRWLCVGILSNLIIIHRVEGGRVNKPCLDMFHNDRKNVRSIRATARKVRYINWMVDSVLRYQKLRCMNKVSNEKQDYREIVYVEYANDGLWVAGFLINKKVDMFVVWVPTCPTRFRSFSEDYRTIVRFLCKASIGCRTRID